MRRALTSVLLLLAIDSSTALGGPRKCKDPELEGAFGCRQVVVGHDAGFVPQTLADRLGLRYLGTIAPLRQSWFESPLGVETKDVLASIKRFRDQDRGSGIESFEVNPIYIAPECEQLNVSILEIAPSDPVFTLQPALAAMRARSPNSARGYRVTVAVLDTGVSRSHPALEGSLISPAIDPLGGSVLADDTANGIDDDVPPDGRIDDGYGHGTAVAGLIHLLAPGAAILPVRVLSDECSGTAFEFAAGIVAAVEAGAQVINLSVGSPVQSKVMTAAVVWAASRGVLVVAPTGNARPGEKPAGHAQFPAREHKYVLSVAAVDNDRVAPSWVVPDPHADLAAPGVGVVAPYRDAFAYLDGSSFSAAFVSGAAAVALDADPTLDARALRHRLRRTAIELDAENPRLRGKLGAGIPDLGALGGDE